MLDKVIKKKQFCGTLYTKLIQITKHKFNGEQNEEFDKTKTHSDNITSVNPHLTS